MQAGDTRKHYPAPGAEAFDGHAEAAGLETRDRRRVAVYNLQTAARQKRGADEALQNIAERDLQSAVDAATGARLELPEDVMAAAEAAEQLCMQRARELDAARNLCRKLHMSENEIATVERCVPESGVAASSFAAAASWGGAGAGGDDAAAAGSGAIRPETSFASAAVGWCELTSDRLTHVWLCER